MSNTSIIPDDVDADATELEYDVFFFDKQIHTTVTSVGENLSEWILNLEDVNKLEPLRLIVGFDVKLQAQHRLALLVLCVYRSTCIFQLPFADSIPPALHRFLSDENNTFVGVGTESKMAQLQQEYGIGGRASHVDLGTLIAAKYNRPDLEKAGLNQLRTFLHGRDVVRPEVDGINWDAAELSNEQVQVACIDAFTSYELGSYVVFPIKKDKDKEGLPIVGL